MTESFLIAHKVRGEPAFDIAHRMECPECAHPTEHWDGKTRQGPPNGCNECDRLGYWWIVSTSGHRAYPWWHEHINTLAIVTDKLRDCPDISTWPDHYPTRAATTISLAEALGFTSKPKPKDTSSPFPRRL